MLPIGVVWTIETNIGGGLRPFALAVEERRFTLGVDPGLARLAFEVPTRCGVVEGPGRGNQLHCAEFLRCAGIDVLLGSVDVERGQQLPRGIGDVVEGLAGLEGQMAARWS